MPTVAEHIRLIHDELSKLAAVTVDLKLGHRDIYLPGTEIEIIEKIEKLLSFFQTLTLTFFENIIISTPKDVMTRLSESKLDNLSHNLKDVYRESSDKALKSMKLLMHHFKKQ